MGNANEGYTKAPTKVVVDEPSGPDVSLSERFWSYLGQVNNKGQRHGQGTCIMENGTKLVGRWKADFFVHGTMCTEKYTHTGSFYHERSYEVPLPHGAGKRIYNKGATYEGSWLHGEKNGPCKVYTDGLLVGEYIMVGDQKVSGTVYYPKGASNHQKYVGEYFNNKQHGRGAIYFNDGSHFEGQFVEGHAHGSGLMFYSNGTTEKEYWVHGKKQ